MQVLIQIQQRALKTLLLQRHLIQHLLQRPVLEAEIPIHFEKHPYTQGCFLCNYKD
jgi:hypothetical protein